jgi:hypothetical protein
MAATTSKRAALRVLRRLPLAHRHAVEYLLSLLCGVAVNEQYTHMTVQNIAIVFAPNLLRNPSDDPLVLAQCMKQEQAFIVTLLKAWLSKHKQRAATAAAAAAGGGGGGGGVSSSSSSSSSATSSPSRRNK